MEIFFFWIFFFLDMSDREDESGVGEGLDIVSELRDVHCDVLGSLDEIAPVRPTLLAPDGHPMTFYIAPCTKRAHIQNLVLVSGD